jgi:hypothetical protein
MAGWAYLKHSSSGVSPPSHFHMKKRMVYSGLQWHNVHTKFHDNLSNHSRVIKCVQMDIMGDDMIGVAFAADMDNTVIIHMNMHKNVQNRRLYFLTSPAQVSSS